MKAKSAPARKCVGCGRVGPRHEFLRVARTGTGQVVDGTAARIAGRSAYVCARSACLSAAKRKNRLERALRAAVPDAIWEALEARLCAGSQVVC